MLSPLPVATTANRSSNCDGSFEQLVYRPEEIRRGLGVACRLHRNSLGKEIAHRRSCRQAIRYRASNTRRYRGCGLSESCAAEKCLQMKTPAVVPHDATAY